MNDFSAYVNESNSISPNKMQVPQSILEDFSFADNDWTSSAIYNSSKAITDVKRRDSNEILESMKSKSGMSSEFNMDKLMEKWNIIDDE